MYDYVTYCGMASREIISLVFTPERKCTFTFLFLESLGFLNSEIMEFPTSKTVPFFSFVQFTNSIRVVSFKWIGRWCSVIITINVSVVNVIITVCGWLTSNIFERTLDKIMICVSGSFLDGIIFLVL